jgi:hypothetical protein
MHCNSSRRILFPPSRVDLFEQIDENQSIPTNESTNMLELDQWDAVLSRVTGTIYRSTERVSTAHCFDLLELGPDPVTRQKIGKRTDSDVRINEFTPLVTAVLVALAAVITSGFGRPFDKPSPLGRCHPPLLVFNNSVRRSRPSCCRPVGAHVMSGELVKLALAGAAASVLICVLSFWHRTVCRNMLGI